MKSVLRDEVNNGIICVGYDNIELWENATTKFIVVKNKEKCSGDRTCSKQANRLNQKSAIPIAHESCMRSTAASTEGQS